MSEIKLGEEILLQEMLGFDTIWTVLFIEGDKLYCSHYNESQESYESIIVHRDLVRKANALK